MSKIGRCILCFFLMTAILSVASSQSDPRVVVLNHSRPESIAYSPDGRWFALADSTLLMLFDAKTLRQRRVFLRDGEYPLGPKGIDGGIAVVKFSPDSRILVHDTEAGYIELWDVETGRECSETHGIHQDRRRASYAVFSRDGRLLALRQGGEIVIRHIRWRKVQATIKVPDRWSVDMRTFTPDNRMFVGLVSIDDDSPDPPNNVITFWDARTGKFVKMAEEDIWHLDYSPDGRFFFTWLRECRYGICDETTRIADVERDETITTIEQFAPIAFTPDSKFILGRGTETLQLRDVLTGDVHQTIEGPTEDVYCLTMSPDGKTLAACDCDEAHEIRFWDIETGKQTQRIRWSLDYAAGFTPDGMVVTVASVPDETPRTGDRIKLFHWHVDTVSLEREIEATRLAREVHVESVSPGGKWFTTEGQGNVAIFDTQTGKLFRTWHRQRLPSEPIKRARLEFSPDERFLAGIWNDDVITIWNIETGDEYRRWKVPHRARLAFSPDGRTLAYEVENGTILLQDFHSGETIRELKGEQTSQSALAFSPDGRLLASAVGSRIIRLLDVVTGQPLYTVESLFGACRKLAFSPDSQLLALGCESGAKVLLVGNGRELLSIGPVWRVDDLAFSPDGRQFVMVAETKTLVWNLPEFISPFPPTTATRPKIQSTISQTALLPNFPNPFNPETWIPFTLERDASVKIHIYDVQGHLVRRLNIGHQIAGQYTCHCTAAYWDGHNEVGERVTSGIYFYILEAEDFRATRKMALIR